MLARLYLALAKRLIGWFGDKPEDCSHEWHVVSTVLSEVSLQVVCYKCMTYGSVPDPTKDEWERAFHAPENSYPWHDEARVEWEPERSKQT